MHANKPTDVISVWGYYPKQSIPEQDQNFYDTQLKHTAETSIDN